jgi:ATP-dependent DNA helicase RecG
LIAQHEALTPRELSSRLELTGAESLSAWMGRLQKWRIVVQTGRTKSTRYYVEPTIMRKMDFSTATTLTRIEPPRLRALILEDLRRHPNSGIGDINRRIGAEISRNQIRKEIKNLCNQGEIEAEKEKRWRQYSLKQKAV